MKLRIAKLPGDGIGPEVVDQAVKAVDAVCRRFGHDVQYSFAYVGACAIDRFGNPYPEETHSICMDSDAVLFGAVGDPKYDNDPNSPVRPEQVGVCPQYVEDGILYAKELRARYTILQLFWDLDLLKPAKDILMKEFVKDEPR